MKNVKMLKWLSLILGLLMIVLSFFYFMNPIKGSRILISMIGILIIVIGVVKMISYIKDNTFKTGAFLIGSLLDIILGILILLNKGAVGIAFVSLVPFWVLFSSISDIAKAFDIKKVGISTWWLSLVSGILGLIIGFMLITDFALNISYTFIIVGIYTLFTGITLIATSLGLTSIKNKFEDFKE